MDQFEIALFSALGRVFATPCGIICKTKTAEAYRQAVRLGGTMGHSVTTGPDGKVTINVC